MEYVMKRLLKDVPFEEALRRTREALHAEGFGIPTEMDTQAIFRQKLHKETPARVILGACFATVAFEALALDPDIAVLLPCNVVVRDLEEGTEVTAVLPTALFTLTGHDASEHATAVELRLRAALDGL